MGSSLWAESREAVRGAAGGRGVGSGWLGAEREVASTGAWRRAGPGGGGPNMLGMKKGGGGMKPGGGMMAGAAPGASGKGIGGKAGGVGAKGGAEGWVAGKAEGLEAGVREGASSRKASM